MKRVWDYLGFAVCFAGLGFVALWLLGSSDYRALPPALHALGAAAAAFVPVRLIMGVIGRRLAAARAVPAAPQKPAAPKRLRRKATYPVRQVKARSHFGLRGVPD